MVITGAATIYHAVKGHTGEAVAFGVGTAYAWQRYEKARKQERARQRAAGTVHSYSADRSSGTARSSGGSSRSASANGASSAASMQTQLAQLKERTEIREAVMQQNLNELATKTQNLEKKNGELTSQLTSAKKTTAQAQRQSVSYLTWALIASVVGLAALGGLAHSMRERGRLSSQGSFAGAMR